MVVFILLKRFIFYKINLFGNVYNTIFAGVNDIQNRRYSVSFAAIRLKKIVNGRYRKSTDKVIGLRLHGIYAVVA